MNQPDSLDKRLPPDMAGLPRWALVTLAMAVGAEFLLLTLSGRSSLVEVGLASSWEGWAAGVGAFLGLPACMLWIGGYASPLSQKLRWLALISGFAHYAYQVWLGEWDGAGGAGAVIPVVLAPLGLLALGSTAHLLWQQKRYGRQKASDWPHLFGWLALLLLCLGFATRSALWSTVYLFPATWDYHVYRIDGAFGAIPATLSSLNANLGPLLQAFTATAYSLLSAALYVLAAVAMRKRTVRRLNVWPALVVPFVFAFVAYAWLPLCGPQYAFFDGRFPGSMPDALSVVGAPVIIPPAFRNGMPSMHLTGALLVWMIALGLRQRVAVLFASGLVLATAWSTLASGEHYALDLVVALPCAAFMGTALIWPRRLRGTSLLSVSGWSALATFVIWMISLRAAPMWLSINPWAVLTLSGVGIISALLVFLQLARYPLAEEVAEGPRPVRGASFPSQPSIKAPLWVVGLFVASGLAGLTYEVVYAKALAVTFGSTALASYTVLATYMGGMALGAWLGGRLADSVRSPLRVYALCEAAIGIYAALTPKLFTLIQQIYVHWSLDVAPDASGMTALRVALGAICLGVPTLMMGATFPLMFKALRNQGVSTQAAIAPLYSANVAGAAVGSVFAGYLLLPSLGRNGSTYVAAVLSLLVAMYALDRDKRKGVLPAWIQEGAIQTTPNASTTHPSRHAGWIALAVLFIGGAVTLALEINAMHLLAVVAGNSVYAFSLMLATFLAGLGLGSAAGQALARHVARLDLVSMAQCGLAVSIAATALLWDELPGYFASFGAYVVRPGFAAREMIRALVCGAAMLPPAFFIGMSYPAAMSLATDWLSPQGGARGMGLASGLNTLGNIVGVLLAGFWLLPQQGSRDLTMVLAVTAFGLGTVAMLANLCSARRAGAKFARRRVVRVVPVLAAFGGLWAIPTEWDYNQLASGSNVYFTGQSWGKVVDHAESVQGGLTMVAKNDDGVLTLLTNGKFQGNDSKGGEMLAQESFALFPLLHTAQRDSALVIGYGTGMTARVLHDADFKTIDVAELSKDIVGLADRHFGSINHGVTRASGVQVHYTDGRNFLLTQSKQFDLISIEITSIWFAGAANLYNQEFYHLAKSRLSQGGVLQQWVQLHHIAPLDLAYIMGSVRAEFEHVWLYVRGGQGIIIASNDLQSGQKPGRYRWIDAKRGTGYEVLPEDLSRHLVLSPSGVNRMLSTLAPNLGLPVSTDVNLFLEHSTPKGNALGDVLNSNVAMLAGFEPRASRTGQDVAALPADVR